MGAPEPEKQKEYAPREEFTDIRVDDKGRWFTGSKHIFNPKVLDYFRKNLKRDPKGVYIFNQFGPFKEKGYIKIEGPPFSVIHISADSFHLNNGYLISISEATLVQYGDSMPLLLIPSLGVWAGFPGKVANDLAAEMTEVDDCFFFRNHEIILRGSIDWLTDYQS